MLHRSLRGSRSLFCNGLTPSSQKSIAQKKISTHPRIGQKIRFAKDTQRSQPRLAITRPLKDTLGPGTALHPTSMPSYKRSTNSTLTARTTATAASLSRNPRPRMLPSTRSRHEPRRSRCADDVCWKIYSGCSPTYEIAHNCGALHIPMTTYKLPWHSRA